MLTQGDNDKLCLGVNRCLMSLYEGLYLYGQNKIKNLI